MSKGSKEAHLVSMKFKSQLWEIISKCPPRLLNRSSRTAVSKDQRAYWPIKTGLQEKQVLQDPGYVEGVETTCCMLHGILQGSTKCRMSKESKEIKRPII